MRRNRQLLQIANASLEQRVADQTAEVRRRTFQLQTLATQLSQAEQRERRRLARVLHDHLQQLLVGAKINLSVAMRQFADEPLRQAMEQVINLLDESIRASRSLAVELSPPVLYKGSFAAAIRWLAERMREKHLLKVELETDEQVNPAADEIRVLLFEIVQELLFNVVKHANAARAFVRIQQGEQDQIRVLVADEGTGFVPHQHSSFRGDGGLGLIAIEERLELLGGRLEIDSAPGKGTRITIVVPRSLPMTQPSNPIIL